MNFRVFLWTSISALRVAWTTKVASDAFSLFPLASWLLVFYPKKRNEDSSLHRLLDIHFRDGRYQSPSAGVEAKPKPSHLLSKSHNNQIVVEDVGGYITVQQGVLGSASTREVAIPSRVDKLRHIVWLQLFVILYATPFCRNMNAG